MKKLFYYIKTFLRNLYNYRKILCTDQQFDFGYLLELEKCKLQLMINTFKDSYIDNNNNIKWISVCLKLIDIVQETDLVLEKNSIGKYSITKYVNIKNASRFGLGPYIPNKNTQALVFTKDTLRKQKALYLYHKIRYNYMFEWWN